MPNTMLLNLIYDAFVSGHGDSGARARANRWLDELNAEPTALDLFRQNTGSIKEFLTESLEDGMPGIANMRQQGLQELRKSTDRGGDDIREALAAGGLQGSGAGANAIADLYENEADAAAALEQALSLQDLNFRSQAAARLLGLENMQLDALASDRAYDLNFYNFLENKRTNDFQIQQQQEMYDAEDDFWGTIGSMIFGGMLGSVTGGVGSAAGASLAGFLFDEL